MANATRTTHMATTEATGMMSALPHEQFNWDSLDILTLIREALDEDVGRGDLTTSATVPAKAVARARLLAKQDIILAGLPLFSRVFQALDPLAHFSSSLADGEMAHHGETVALIEGQARMILSAERTALNFLAHLSGIATLTRRYVEAIAGTHARILDTRKTTPGLRALEKYAVRMGGGINHRFGLFDAILIKENHIALAGGVVKALGRAKAYATAREPVMGEMTACESFHEAVHHGSLPIQVEVRNQAELREAFAAGAHFVLLDNVAPEEAAQLVAIAHREAPGCLIDLSGGVTVATARAYAEAGVDFISVGALTHSAAAADLSLLVEPILDR